MVKAYKEVYPSLEPSAKTKEASVKPKEKLPSTTRAKGIDDMKIVPSSSASQGPNEEKLLMEALELIQELEILLTLFHTKDTTNQSKIATSLEKEAKAQGDLQEVQEKQMDVLRHEAEERAKAMRIVSIIVGALSVLAAAFMGPGALVMASTLFAMQESGAMNKMTAHMGAGAKLGLTIGISLAGALAGAGIDGAIGSAINSSVETGTEEAADQIVEEASEKETFSLKKQMTSSFKSVGYNSFAQALSSINPTQDLLEKLGMSKKSAAILAGIINSLIALIAIIKSGKESTNVLSTNPKLKGLAKLIHPLESQRILSGVQGGTGISQSVLGFQMMDIQKSMANLEKSLAPIHSLLYLIHEMMENVNSLMQMTSQVQTNLQKSFASEMQALGTLPMTWETAARVLTNSAA